jgi:hypothetical protein
MHSRQEHQFNAMGYSSTPETRPGTATLDKPKPPLL